jgi:hypothetical protein
MKTIRSLIAAALFAIGLAGVTVTPLVNQGAIATTSHTTLVAHAASVSMPVAKVRAFCLDTDTYCPH